MSGDTHTTTGVAVALALATAMPKVTGANYTDLAFCVGASVVGALYSDLDSAKSKGNKLLDKVLLVGIPMMILCYFFTKQGVRNAPSFSTEELVSIAVFLGIGLWGRTRPHREAMHSFLIGAVATCAVYGFTSGFVCLWFAAGFLSHLALDLLNTKDVQLFWPLNIKFCLGICKASGIGDWVAKIISCCAIIFFLSRGVL